MKVRISISAAKGEVMAPGSKSMAHRLLISAGMAEGVSVISGVTPSEDVLATVDCLNALGVNIHASEGVYTVEGTNMKKTAPRGSLYCRESGSTLRFMIPVATLSGARVCFSGAKKLLERPLSVYEEIYDGKNMLFKRLSDILYVDGPLEAGEYTVRGDVSSQFITGLIFALPVLDGDSILKIIPPFESRSYIDLTLAAVKKFGIFAEFTDEYTIRIPGNQSYRNCSSRVEGDYSGAAFLEALNYVGGDVTVLGLNPDSAQGDRVYLEYFPRLKKEKMPLINVEDCPDLAPILMALAAYHNGAVFEGTRRLVLKECDRADAMKCELAKLGADITVEENRITVRPAPLHAPSSPIDSHNDHRIVMALAILLTEFGGEIIGAEAVAKSYPDFFGDLERLGVEVKKYD